MDVKNAFLHGDLRETVYLKPPLGYACPPKHVCKLRKALYGLKQAPRAWFDKFRTAILQAGFRQSHSDSSLFIRWTPKGYTFLLVYVDDMILSGNDVAGITDLKLHLTRHFRVKDLGPLTYFLGLDFVHNKSGIRVHQRKYATDLINSARLDDAHTVDTPM